MANPMIYLIGAAHLDPIWLWRWQEGCGEVLQTFRSALDRLSEYPGFVFTCSSAGYYKWVEETDPDMFEEIRRRVAEGRWVPVNGWWIQPDCNIPSGESFARQALYSQLYYYEKFGLICRTGYNVDSFGHSAMLPQLLRLGGMDSYVFHRPGPTENPDIPDRFLWESADGSKVIAFHIPESYTCSGKESLDRRIDMMNAMVEKENGSVMMFYGVGNHGGGPTRADIEYLSSRLSEDGKAEMQFSDPDKYFNDVCLEGTDLPVWRGDLQHHASGCYSATGMVKALNRRAENLLYASEVFSAVAHKSYGMTDFGPAFREAWREVCFNQFHDILCGCSIREAYDDVAASEGHAIDIAETAYNQACLRISGKINTWIPGVSDVRSNGRTDFPRPVVVFNPLSYAVEVPVQTYGASTEVRDSEGREAVFQNVRSSRSNDSHRDTLFIAKIPPLGYETYHMRLHPHDTDIPTGPATDVRAEGLTIENKYIKAVFDNGTGFITSLVDKTTGRDWARADSPAAVPTVISDTESDTWAHNVFKFHNIAGVCSLEDIELVETGPARAMIRTRHRYGCSRLTQEFSLASGDRLLRVKCKALWQEKFTLLKLSFPTPGENPHCVYDIPGGFIRRPADGDEEPAGRWAAVSADDAKGTGSLAIINDSKYSYDCPGGNLRLTAIRNVIFADHYSHRPPADFDFTDEGMNRFEYAVFLCAGEPQDCGVEKEAGAFNIRPVCVSEGYHKGEKPQRASFLQVSRENVVMTAFKTCEQGDGSVIARFRETQGIETRVNIMCDMLDCGIRVDFGAHEIKSFRIYPTGKVEETNFLEGIASPR